MKTILHILQESVVYCLYSQNIGGGSLRTSFVPNVLLVIRFLQLTLLNSIQIESQKLLSSLFQILQLPNITHIQSLNVHNILRVGLWIIYSLLFLSQVLHFVLKLTTAKPTSDPNTAVAGKSLRKWAHWKVLVINCCDSFQLIVERVLFIPTLQFLFYSNSPTTAEGVAAVAMRNNRSLGLGIQALFLILFIVSTIRSISTRLGVRSFSKLLEDRTLERNKLFSILEPVAITLLVWISGLVREANLNVVTLDSCLIVFGFLIVMANLGWQTLAHSSAHALLGKLATLLISHSIIHLIAHASERKDNFLSVIYFIFLPFALKMYINLHRLIFRHDGKLSEIQQISWFQSLRLHRMIRTTAEKLTLETDHSDEQLSIASFITSGSDVFETDDKMNPGNKDRMNQDQLVQRLLLKVFESLSNQKNSQSFNLTLDYICYEMFYAKKSAIACLHTSNYIHKSTSSFQRIVLEHFLEFAENYVVSHMSIERREQCQRKFYDGIRFDQLHTKILLNMERIKENYINFYSQLAEGDKVSLQQIYKRGRTHFKFIEKTASDIEQLILLNPNAIEPLHLKLHLQENIMEETGSELRLLKVTIDTMQKKNLGHQKTSVKDVDVNQMDRKYYYMAVDISAEVGRIAHCSQNLLTDYGYANRYDGNNGTKLHLSAILPPNVAEVHDNILRNFVYTVNEHVWQRQLPSIFARTNEGYIVPVSIITTFEIINSQIFATAVMKQLHSTNFEHHIMISGFGRIISYSKGLTESELNLPPLASVANFNICFFIPELMKYLFEDSKNSEKLYPADNETDIMNLIFYDFSKVNLNQKELVEFQKIAERYEKGEVIKKKKLKECWFECLEYIQLLKLDSYQVTMKLIKKDFTKNQIFFKAIEIYRIRQITGKDKIRNVMGRLKQYFNVKKLIDLESSISSAATLRGDLKRRHNENSSIRFSEEDQNSLQELSLRVALPDLIGRPNRNKQSLSSKASSQGAMKRQKGSFGEIGGSSQASTKSKGTLKSIKSMLWKREITISVLNKYSLIASVCAIVLLSLLSFQFGFNYSNTNVLSALIDYMEKPLDVIRTWNSLSKRARGVSLVLGDVINRTQVSQMWSDRSGPFAKSKDVDQTLQTALFTLWNSSDSWRQVGDYLETTRVEITFPNNQTSKVTLPEVMLQNLYYIREYQQYKVKGIIANQDTPVYRFVEYNELKVVADFEDFVDYIVDKKEKLLSSILSGNLIIVIISVVLSFAVTACCFLIYSKIRSTKMRILALFCRIPKVSLVKALNKFSDVKRIEERKKKKTEKEIIKKKDRLFVTINSKKEWIMASIPVFLVLFLALNASYLWVFGITQNAVRSISQGIEDYQIMKNCTSLNEISLSTAYGFFAALAYKSPADIEAAYKRYIDQKEIMEMEFNRFSGVLMLFGTPRASEFYPESINQMFTTSRDSNFCSYVPSSVTPFCLNTSIQNITSSGILRSMKFFTTQFDLYIQTIYYSTDRLSQLKSIGFTDNFMLLDDLRMYCQNFQTTTTTLVKANVFSQIASSIDYLKKLFIGLCVVMVAGMGVGWGLFVRQAFRRINKTVRMLAILPQSILTSNPHIRAFIKNDLKIRVVSASTAE